MFIIPGYLNNESQLQKPESRMFFHHTMGNTFPSSRWLKESED